MLTSQPSLIGEGGPGQEETLYQKNMMNSSRGMRHRCTGAHIHTEEPQATDKQVERGMNYGEQHPRP